MVCLSLDNLAWNVALDVLEIYGTYTHSLFILDGVLYVKVVDPVKASYGVDNALFAISQLAQVCMPTVWGSTVGLLYVAADLVFVCRCYINMWMLAGGGNLSIELAPGTLNWLRLLFNEKQQQKACPCLPSGLDDDIFELVVQLLISRLKPWICLVAHQQSGRGLVVLTVFATARLCCVYLFVRLCHMYLSYILVFTLMCRPQCAVSWESWRLTQRLRSGRCWMRALCRQSPQLLRHGACRWVQARL